MALTRRELLKRAGVLGASAAASYLQPFAVAHAFARPQARPGAVDALAAMRRQLAASPIEATKVTNLITMFSGPGGNVVVRHGEEGKVVVDTFVQGAFDALKQRLDALANTPILVVANTHWHFDHTDNNEAFRQAGAEIVAHENTKRRLTESHVLLGMNIPPSPAAALPTTTFRRYHVVRFDLPGTEEYIDLEYLPPAHTDTDVSVRFPMGDVLMLGDTFFNGTYPVIDVATGGNINGMIGAAEASLRDSNLGTRIVPGHGPLADRAALAAFRDMLSTVRDRVQKLKAAGRSEADVVAARPTMDFDEKWGGGFVPAAAFVSTVYATI